jgi:uncharacterized OsmC-like protein
MKISASVDSKQNRQEAVVETNGHAQHLPLPVKPSGFGSAVNGGELLLLALATCFCNDLYREAAKKGIPVSGVEVQCSGDFGAEGEPGSNFTYAVKVQSVTSPEVLSDLVRHTDRVAEVHNTLRKGLAVTLIAD